MTDTELLDPIEVIALFQKGKLTPLKFRWRERVYKVFRINGTWRQKDGTALYHFFSVCCDGPEVYELSFNNESQAWRMERLRHQT